MGCQIAARLAATYPRRVRRLVLQGPTVDRRGRSFAAQVGRWLRAGPKEPFSPNGVLAADYADCGLVRALRTFHMALATPLEDDLPRVRCPTLVVRGQLDPIVTQTWAEEITRLLPDGRLVVLPGAGHTINYAYPLELSRVITPFLLEGEDGRRAA
jgi:2-hydroxy-6-oxonona-2,4-dienedioate hydrolase